MEKEEEKIRYINPLSENEDNEKNEENAAVFLVVKTREGKYTNVSIKGNDPEMEKELEKITKKEEEEEKKESLFYKISRYIPYFETLVIIISLVVFLFQEFIIRKSSEINVEDIFYIEQDPEIKKTMMYINGILCLLYFFIMMKDFWFRYHSKTHIGVKDKTIIMGYVPKTIIIFWIWMIVFFGLFIYHLIEFMILLTGKNPFKDDNEETNEEVTVPVD